jgi:hypothetical protein
MLTLNIPDKYLATTNSISARQQTDQLLPSWAEVQVTEQSCDVPYFRGCMAHLRYYAK